jgi:cytochrome c5
MKKIIFYSLLLTILTFAIAACGGKKETPATDVKTETVKAESAYKTWTPNFENGKKIYGKTCMTCHFAGVTNAPALQPEKYKLEDWQKRADKGIDSLMYSALNGRPGTTMVARGTCPDCTDQDLFDAIQYMYREAKATIK